MKVRNYENKNIIYILIITTILIEIIGLILLSSNKLYSYKRITGIVIKDRKIELIIDKTDRLLIYNNSKLFIDSIDTKYKIIEDRGILLTNKKDYYELIIELDNNKKYKSKDIVELTIRDKKYSLIKIFKIIWDGA